MVDAPAASHETHLVGSDLSSHRASCSKRSAAARLKAQGAQLAAVAGAVTKALRAEHAALSQLLGAGGSVASDVLIKASSSKATPTGALPDGFFSRSILSATALSAPTALWSALRRWEHIAGPLEPLCVAVLGVTGGEQALLRLLAAFEAREAEFTGFITKSDNSTLDSRAADVEPTKATDALSPAVHGELKKDDGAMPSKQRSHAQSRQAAEAAPPSSDARLLRGMLPTSMANVQEAGSRAVDGGRQLRGLSSTSQSATSGTLAAAAARGSQLPEPRHRTNDPYPSASKEPTAHRRRLRGSLRGLHWAEDVARWRQEVSQLRMDPEAKS